MYSYGSTLIAPFRIRVDGTSFMIWYFLILSWLATVHNSSDCSCTAGWGVCLFRSGGQPSSHIWGKKLTKPATKWTIRSGTTSVAFGIKLSAPYCRRPPRAMLNVPVNILLITVAMISLQWGSHQVACSTIQPTSWWVDYCIGMRYSVVMMMMRTGQILPCRAVAGALLAMAITITTARAIRTRRPVRKGPEKRWDHRMRTRNWRQSARWRGRQWRNGRRRGRETVKDRVLLTKHNAEMIDLVRLFYSWRMKCMRHTRAQRAR